MSAYYPIMLNLAGRRCLVVGGGKVAERKLASLLAAGAKVTVISPQWSEQIEAWRQAGVIQVVSRAYAEGDVNGYALVFAATPDREVNAQVVREAAAAGSWVNAADRSSEGTFLVPSIVRRGKLVLAVSTSGASPGLAGGIAQELARSYGDEYELYVDFLSEVRLKAGSQVKDRARRERLFRRLLEAQVLERIRKGTFASWRRKLLEALDSDPSLARAEAVLGTDTDRG